MAGSSIIVGSGYSYRTCTTPGCRNKSPKFYGENDGQGRGLDEMCRRLGWRVSFERTDVATCPECLEAERHSASA